jgi:hypothetical protein
MHLHVLDYVLWLTSPCLQVGVLIVMRRRGLDREFPLFFAYTILQVVSDAFLVGMERISYRVYFYSYWIVAVLCVLISFALIDELFKTAFQRFAALRDVGETVFHWAVVVVVLAAVVVALASRHMPQNQRLSEGILITDRSARAMLCGLVILLLVGSAHLGISRRGLLFGIALGFAILTLTKVVLDTVALRRPWLYLGLGRINSVVYICACAIWLSYATLSGRHRVIPAGHSEEFDPASVADDAPAGTALDAINSMVERKFRG